MSATSRAMHHRRQALSGGLAGLLAGAAAVAVSEAVAVRLVGVTSPLLAVGNRVVDATPRPVKEWAIERFGTNDKAALLGGVVLTVALLAAVVGAVGARRPRVALGAVLGLSLGAGPASGPHRGGTAQPPVRQVSPLGACRGGGGGRP